MIEGNYVFRLGTYCLSDHFVALDKFGLENCEGADSGNATALQQYIGESNPNPIICCVLTRSRHQREKLTDCRIFKPRTIFISRVDVSENKNEIARSYQ